MEIQCLPLGYLQTNCYILTGKNNRCLVIDPGDRPSRVLDYLDRNGLTLEAILLTHGHFDHVGGVKPLAEETGCPVYLCTEDLALPATMTAGPLHYTCTYDEGDTVSLAGLTFTVLRTPGHTPGSVCLQFGDSLFTGDTLFAGSCGRTDFPGSDPAAMVRSLRRLRSLEGVNAIYPGHGESTTLDEEKRYNPYLR